MKGQRIENKKVGIKLRDAKLCINCEEIATAPGGQCPGCGSKHIFPMSRWLNRNGGETGCKHLRRLRIGQAPVGEFHLCLDCLTTVVTGIERKEQACAPV